MIDDLPYYTAPELAALFCMKLGTLRNKLSNGTFPVPTYKLGKQCVADKEVVRAWFAAQRERGLAQVRKTLCGSGR